MAGTASSGPGLRHQGEVGGVDQRRVGDVGDRDGGGAAGARPRLGGHDLLGRAGLGDADHDGVGQVEPGAVVGGDARRRPARRGHRRASRAGSDRRSRRCRSSRGPRTAPAGGRRRASRSRVSQRAAARRGCGARPPAARRSPAPSGWRRVVDCRLLGSLTSAGRTEPCSQLVRTRPYQSDRSARREVTDMAPGSRSTDGPRPKHAQLRDALAELAATELGPTPRSRPSAS